MTTYVMRVHVDASSTVPVTWQVLDACQVAVPVQMTLHWKAMLQAMQVRKSHLRHILSE